MTTLADIQRHVGVTPDGVWGPNTANAIAKALGIGPKPHALKDAAAFYSGVRKVTGALDNVQVAVINALLKAGEGWGPGHLAYALATGWHEARLRPIEEIGKGRGRPYGKPGRHGGQIAYGRGLVQLTWDYNYARADNELGLGGKLIADYALALDADLAVRIMVEGMTRGWFTGKSLGTYIGTGLGTYAEFVEARRIINGTDRAALIADYAVKFQDALTDGGWA